MTKADWLLLYRTPGSVIFNRTPSGFKELLALLAEGRIVSTGTTDSGGHVLYTSVTR